MADLDYRFREPPFYGAHGHMGPGDARYGAGPLPDFMRGGPPHGCGAGPGPGPGRMPAFFEERGGPGHASGFHPGPYFDDRPPMGPGPGYTPYFEERQPLGPGPGPGPAYQHHFDDRPHFYAQGPPPFEQDPRWGGAHGAPYLDRGLHPSRNFSPEPHVRNNLGWFDFAGPPMEVGRGYQGPPPSYGPGNYPSSPMLERREAQT
mmetsp:Transcript_53762/g.174829  ORF Transcript_53762/g.174829 Transcript_53762/m.174829 type:complete len:204 (+) Transcript_53762:94-705(+)